MGNHGNGRDNVQWDDDPPPEDRKFVPIISPKGSESVRGIIVSHRMYGVWTHYLERRTVPCTGHQGLCQECEDKVPRRWKGYVGIWLPGACRYAIAEITADAARHCPDIKAKGCNLRGCLIRVFRIGAHKNAPCRVELAPPPKASIVPREFDVQMSLYRIWGMLRDSVVELDQGEEGLNLDREGEDDDDV
jgi:hypothetical protein